MTSISEGQVWIGRAHGIRGRTIMITGVNDGEVSYALLAPSPAASRSNKPGIMVVRSLQQAYRPADDEEASAVTGGPEHVIDLTEGQRCVLRCVEIKTEAGTVRVSVNLDDPRAGGRVVLVEAEPDGGWGIESELSWAGQMAIMMRPDR